jgi:hypothetical protein
VLSRGVWLEIMDLITELSACYEIVQDIDLPCNPYTCYPPSLKIVYPLSSSAGVHLLSSLESEAPKLEI